MNSFLGSCLVFATCLGSQADTPAAYAPGSPGKEKGRILILESLRVIEGDIDRVGDQYRVRRGMGEVLLPAATALRLCASWDEAYEFMRSRANLADPDERLRLARWCQLNGLRAQALAEVTAAVEMRPDYPEARQLQALLTRPSTTAMLTSAPKPAAKPKNTEPSVDLSADALAFYMSKVQPILLNACANCHTAGRGGAFQIHRANDAGGHRAALQKTLASIIAQVNLDSPALSPLLVKAVSVHFPSGPAPLGGRQSAPFKTLERWVNGLPESNPHLRGGSLAAVSELVPGAPQRLLKKGPAPPPNTFRQIMQAEQPKPAVKVKADTDVNEKPNPPSAVEPPTKINTPEFLPATPAPPTKINPAPTAPALPTDPFDPIIFNRQMHPKR